MSGQYFCKVSSYIDKAHEIYSALPVEHSAKYQVVKDAVLRNTNKWQRHTGKSLEAALKMTNRPM